jgi:hypothetical protein
MAAVTVLAPLAPAGVKHLHHEALAYGVGVYFEANGHGTVCVRVGLAAWHAAPDFLFSRACCKNPFAK